MATARGQLADHSQILLEPEKPGWVARNFTPRDALALHDASVAFIDRMLARPHDGPTVVVTHHAPHRRSIHPRFSGDALTPASSPTYHR
jgi:broad specificity phosphatase PhoE